ncbi:MAG: acetyl/propionyl/methylcrotonyl-CoA carboxylase subunit alpha [Aggregatilineales bacterium]
MTVIIRKILIANRGEIACRIIRTCREMGIAAVAVYSDADARALHVEQADEAVHIGASPPSESYLNIPKLIEAARRAGADAVHPGYGFLAENADFARACAEAGLVFIGPPASAIEAMGKKRAAKLMLKGIPVVPGYTGADQSDQALIDAAAQIGYPVMVKASAGGGGKGMRRVDAPADMPAALAAARREALQAFADDTLILERVVDRPRHVEVQIFGDQRGNVIALGERECTIQRRHQKIIEETPSTALTPELRERMCAAAVSVGQQLGYYSAGTVEFLVDRSGAFYFMEMNTRLQVEHPVTELVTGLDLVRWQILVAEGHPLPALSVPAHGHAIEARVYAEDPSNDFLPVTGTILRWKPPEGVRVESGVRTGDEVTIHYDPMIAKIVAYGEHREGAIRRLDRALAELQLLGLRSNISFLRRVINHPDHIAGNISTTFIDERPDLLAEDPQPPLTALIAAALGVQSGQRYWRNNPNRPLRQRFAAGNTEHTVLLTPLGADAYQAQIGETACNVHVWARQGTDLTLAINDHRQTVSAVAGDNGAWWIHTNDGTYSLVWRSPLPEPGARARKEGSLRAPMPGQVVAVLVEAGQQVNEGDTLLILEAMKMEHRIKAPYSGLVEAVHYQTGQTVQGDAVLLDLKAEAVPEQNLSEP